jgi:putative peptidoglycan lipid II flippase
LSFFRAIATVGGFTLMSRIAGFARDLATAALLGAGPVADAFFVAQRLPNLFRSLFAEGAFSVSFVPLYARTLQGEGPAAARLFAEHAVSLLVFVLMPLSALAIVFMPALLALIAPGFEPGSERYALALDLARIAFPYLLLASLTALYGGVLNALGRFAHFAAAPVAYNLVVLASLFLLTPLLPSAGHALAVGVAAAGIVQVVWMAGAAARAGMGLRLRLPRFGPRIRRLLVVMGPGALGAGVTQINSFVSTLLATTLPVGAVSFLYYADRLYQLPLGVVGTAVSTALLPMLAKALKAEDRTQAQSLFARAVEIALALTVPAAIALFLLAEPIVAALFERGAFDAADTAGTAGALAAYAFGVPAFVLVKVLATACFAREDTLGPVKIGIVAALANIALGLALIGGLAHVGLAMATVAAAWMQVALLALLLARRGHLHLDRRCARRLPRLALAALAMGGALWLLRRALAPALAGPEIERLTALLALVAAGGIVYFGVALLIGGLRVEDVKALRRRAAS